MKLEVEFLIDSQEELLSKAIQAAKKLYPTAEIKPVISTRTEQQNKALHLFFTQLAEELNEKGMDMRKLIRPEVEISWTTYSVKEYLWKPIQKILTGKKSTTKLDKTQEINLIYDNLNRIIVERTKGEINFPPFPCIETMLGEEKDPTSYNQF